MTTETNIPVDPTVYDEVESIRAKKVEIEQRLLEFRMARIKKIMEQAKEKERIQALKKSNNRAKNKTAKSARRKNRRNK